MGTTPARYRARNATGRPHRRCRPGLLPADKFVRVHRSYVVAVPHIDKVERHQVTIHNRRIPVSEAYRQGLAATLQK